MCGQNVVRRIGRLMLGTSYIAVVGTRDGATLGEVNDAYVAVPGRLNSCCHGTEICRLPELSNYSSPLEDE